MAEIGNEKRTEEDECDRPSRHDAWHAGALDHDREPDHEPGREAGYAEDARLGHAGRMTQRWRRVNRPEVTCRALPRAAHARRRSGAYLVQRRISLCESLHSLPFSSSWRCRWPPTMPPIF